jgi:hypothetical protein
MWAASREQFGVVVKTNDTERLRQLLYGVRRNNMADFAHLRLTVLDGQVWVLNKEGLQEMENKAD